MPSLGLNFSLGTALVEIASSIKRFWQSHVDDWEDQADVWEQAT
jgi:hypothetical protein